MVRRRGQPGSNRLLGRARIQTVSGLFCRPHRHRYLPHANRPNLCAIGHAAADI
jgi:hypothetical protein